MALADRANQYIDEKKPWIMAKDAGAAAEVVAVCTLGLNLFRALIVYLKPIVPALAARAEALLAGGELRWQDAATPLVGTKIAKFEALLTRVELATVESLMKSATTEAKAVSTPSSDAAPRANGEIDLEEFQKTELRVARVVEASYVDGADKLLKLKLDVGDEERTVFSGIRSSYEPAALTNRLVILVANLAPRKMRFGVSQGMVLAASGDEPGIFLLSPDSGAKPGMKVS
jgi:methionyl-tRNA synthetase